MVGMIVAMTRDRAIGAGGAIPWNYPGDLKRFKAITLDRTVVMGRVTWESIGSKPLPRRRNLVVSRGTTRLPGAEVFPSVEAALAACKGEDVWIIGGGMIYREALPYADLIDVTHIPETLDRADAVHFPELNPATWSPGPVLPHEENPALTRQVFTRRA